MAKILIQLVIMRYVNVADSVRSYEQEIKSVYYHYSIYLRNKGICVFKGKKFKLEHMYLINKAVNSLYF